MSAKQLLSYRSRLQSVEVIWLLFVVIVDQGMELSIKELKAQLQQAKEDLRIQCETTKEKEKEVEKQMKITLIKEISLVKWETVQEKYRGSQFDDEITKQARLLVKQNTM